MTLKRKKPSSKNILATLAAIATIIGAIIGVLAYLKQGTIPDDKNHQSSNTVIIKGNSLLKLSERINADPNFFLEETPNSFCVTEDNIFLLPNQESKRIMIFEKVIKNEKSFLEFKEIAGPEFRGGTFDKPIYCTYDSKTRKLGVIDIGAVRKIFLFERSGKFKFNPIKFFEFNCDSYDIAFTGDGKQMVVSGLIRNRENKDIALYSIDINSGQPSYLLPCYKQYSLKSEEEYQDTYFKDESLPAIGIKSFIDICEDKVFFVWEGKLRILEVGLSSGGKEKFLAGLDMPNSNNKGLNNELTKLYEKGKVSKNFTEWKKKQKMRSYVRNIFSTNKRVFVVFETGISESVSESEFILVTYNIDGTLLDSYKISSNPGSQMWFDKEKYELYAFSRKSGSDKSEFPILKYKIKIK